MIEFKSVCLKYPNGNTALHNIDLKISAGELVCITGPSGSGKTSLLKLIIGTVKPTEGVLDILDNNGRITNRGIKRNRTMIGPVFQEFRLIKGRTAFDNVVIAMRFLKFSKDEMRENAIDALKKVGLEQKIKEKVENLSWGEMQRVAIARAIARKPRIILADEPTGNLDKDNAEKTFDILSSLKDENTAIIITTHATHLITHIKADRHIHIDNGRIISIKAEEIKK